MLRSAANDVAHLGVRVNVIQPGPIRTAMTEAMPQHVREQKLAYSTRRAADPQRPILWITRLPCLGVRCDDSAAADSAVAQELIGLVGVVQREVFDKHLNLSGLREGDDLD